MTRLNRIYRKGDLHVPAGPKVHLFEKKIFQDIDLDRIFPVGDCSSEDDGRYQQVSGGMQKP